MVIPNLFIVGAAKCGTTTVAKCLGEHPSVYMPDDELFKEPAFFSSVGERIGKEKYLNIFQLVDDSHQYVGEASTAYLTDENSAKRIFEYNPSAKIIVLLRNPAERAYSLYNWMVKDGYEYETTFEKALLKEKKRSLRKIPNFFEPEYCWNYMYFESGLYFKQVKRYIDVFGREGVFVIKFEDFVDEPLRIYRSICLFLGIEYQPIIVTKGNEGKKVYHPSLSFLARKVNNNINRFRGLISPARTKKQRDFLVYLLQSTRPLEKMNSNTRKKLLCLYLSDIEKLEGLIEMDLSTWKSN